MQYSKLYWRFYPTIICSFFGEGFLVCLFFLNILKSAQHRFGYIITNTPMDNTVEDFLSMVEEQEVYTIVQLTDNDEVTD